MRSACRDKALVYKSGFMVSRPHRGQRVYRPFSCFSFKSRSAFFIRSVIAVHPLLLHLPTLTRFPAFGCVLIPVLLHFVRRAECRKSRQVV